MPEGSMNKTNENIDDKKRNSLKLDLSLSKDQLNRVNVENRGLEPITACVLGATGAGKTSFIKSISQAVSSGLTDVECTRDDTLGNTKDLLVKYPARRSIRIVDTAGLRKNKYGNVENGQELKLLLNTLRFVSCYLLLINGQCSRLTRTHEDILKEYVRIITTDGLEKSILVFTRWDCDDVAKQRRQRSGENEEMKLNDMNNYLRETFGISKPLPGIFIDNFANMADNKQKDAVDETVKKTLNLIQN